MRSLLARLVSPAHRRYEAQVRVIPTWSRYPLGLPDKCHFREAAEVEVAQAESQSLRLDHSSIPAFDRPVDRRTFQLPHGLKT